MLYSHSARIAFAHYPKTAGSSLNLWFRGVFPDADLVEPGNPHLPVRPALRRLARTGPRALGSFARHLARLTWRLPLARRQVGDVQIFGVVREPFEMLVSLYEFWRRHRFPKEPEARLIRAARSGTFREFLQLAVGEGLLDSYESHFDVDGPAWPRTRLIDFASLEPGLAEVCRDFGIPEPTGLARRNAAPRRSRDIGDYLAEAGSLAFEVRSHFRWYYDEGVHIMVRGQVEQPARRLAA
jgi:hypothetical protein